MLYGAFQAMRGKRVNLGESIRVGLRRFFPVVGVAIGMAILVFLASLLFLIPGMILFVTWFVARPACVVEGRGVFASMARSAELTRGLRWKIFSLMILVYLSDGIVDNAIDQTSSSVAGGIPAFAGHVIWNGVWNAFYAIVAVVTYHDLRVAKEGVDIEQIAAVFE